MPRPLLPPPPGDAGPTSSTLLKAGDEIDIWIVDRPLGQGGMGSVYRCHNREAKRILAAVKVLDASLGRLPRAKARFVREAEILHGLDHPNIVKVRNVRMDVEIPYLEMEYIDGINLESRIQEGPLTPADALPLFVQVADALAYLHPRGIRHRDVKPSNLVVQADGVVKLVDFGIAMEADGVTLTEQGQTFGSVSYAPPEWLDPKLLDPVRWDVYAAGLVFYEVLTGRQAFPTAGDGTMQQQVMRMIAIKQRNPPLDPGPSVPRGLRALIRDMTHPHPESRIADAATVRARLAEVDLSDLEPASAAGESTWYPDSIHVEGVPAGATMVPGYDGFVPREALRSPTPLDPALQGRESLARGPAPPPSSSRAPMLGLILGLGLAGVALTFAGFAAYTLVPPDTREVRLTVLGYDPKETVAITLAGVEGRYETPTWIFTDVPVGDAALSVVHGPAGQSCEGDAPWCLREDSTVPIRASREPMPWSITLRPLTDRDVTVSAAALPGETALTLTVGPLSATGPASGVPLPLAPGRHVAHITCPSCTPWQGALTVPAGDGTVALAVDVEPAPIVQTSTPRVVTPSDTPRTTEARGGRVTNRAFARWLTTHPEWAPAAARESGRADARYLARWTDGAPPEGKEGAAVTDVSWAAADAYCASRGGLAPLDAPPLTWTESEPWVEFRSAGGTPAWRRSDGGESQAVKRNETGVLSGFRCAR